MKILVTGKKGQVALSLQNLSSEGIDVVSLGRPQLDITNKEQVGQVLDAVKPDIVVNAAAFTDVAGAEQNCAAAFSVNRDGAAHVAEATAARGLPLIHISTDYVFNGDKNSAYCESDAVGALNIYGLSKLQGEWAVQKANPKHVILRTAWVYSPYSRNFVKTMLELAKTRDEVSVVCDQWGTPTSASLIARSIVAVSQKIVNQPQENYWGLFHLVADGKTNFAHLAREIFHIMAQKTGKTYPFVQDVSSENYPSPVRRPQFSHLSNEKFKSCFEINLPKWDNLLHDELSSPYFLE